MKMRTRILAAGAVAAAIAMTATAAVTTAPASAATTCGTWRWPVKTGSDASRYQVSRTPWYTGVNYLDSLVPPSSFGSYAQNHRIKWPEYHTWRINYTTLVAIKLEGDGDLHLRLRSTTGKTMIGEIPSPACVPSWSLWRQNIAATRAYLTNRFWVSSYSWHYLYRKVNIQGLGFFDEEHNVTGAAPNDFELHPVTWIYLD
jgi:hypothetical protein